MKAVRQPFPDGSVLVCFDEPGQLLSQMAPQMHAEVSAIESMAAQGHVDNPGRAAIAVLDARNSALPSALLCYAGHADPMENGMQLVIAEGGGMAADVLGFIVADGAMSPEEHQQLMARYCAARTAMERAAVMAEVEAICPPNRK